MTVVSLPLAFVFDLITWLLVRSRELRAWQAVTSGLFGFYLAGSHIAPFIGSTVSWVLTGFLHAH